MARRSRSGEVAGNFRWDQILTTCTFEEENWSPCVAWVVGRQTEDFNHVEALNIIVQTGIRKLFSVITKEQLFLDVREIGNLKNKKVKDVVPNAEICEACKVYLDANESIPTPLLAKLIKWKMITLKDADIKRRGNDFKSASDKKRAKDSSKERVKSPKKGGKKSPEAQQAKEGSKMKKRGEDDDESKFIDDEPEDGAQLYILVTGFHDPHLFQFLETINIKVHCVIGISSQEYFTPKISSIVDDKSECEMRWELKAFWRDILPLLQQQPDTSSLHDIARLDYEVSSLIVPTESLDAEQKVHYSTALFDDISAMLYNLIDARRLYLTYLLNMKLIHVPLYEQKETTSSPQFMRSVSSAKMVTASDKIAQAVVDMRYYNDLMNTIPLESVSVPLIMHCMLEQVVATEKGTEPPSEQVIPIRTDGFSSELSAYFAEMTAKLGLTSEEHEMLSQVLDFPQSSVNISISPQLININDEISIRTHHLMPCYGFCADDIERSMLQFNLFSKLCHVHQPNATELKERAVRLQELLHYCALEDLPPPEIDHILKQFVFESMDLTKCDRNGFPLQRVREGIQEQAIPWDDPYPYFKIMIPTSQKSTMEDIAMPVTSNAENKDITDGELLKVIQNKVSNDGMIAPKNYKFGMNQRKTCITPTKIKKEEGSGSVNSLDIKKGILVSSSNISHESLKHSVNNSVHFDVPMSNQELDHMCDDLSHKISTHYSLLEITDAQLRNLDNWCFAEHFKPDILLQILQEAAYHLPFIETYNHKRDQSIMIALHNPYNKDRQNNMNWHKELHSNTGFRNYLENIAESIQAWLKKKDAEYHAQLLSKEVANIHKEEEEKVKAAEKTDKKGKRSPPRSGTSKNKSPRSSGTNSPDKSNIATNNPYIRQGSLKAHQEEQARIAIEEDEKDKFKLERKIKSAQKIKEKLDREKEKLAKHEKSGTKSPQKDGEITPTYSTHSQVNDTKIENENMKSEPHWAFYGYDTGNKLIHMLGSTSTMFPSDGGTIKTERTEILQGNISVRSVVEKDGHAFVVHIINPREDLNLPDDYVEELEAVEIMTDESILIKVTSELTPIDSNIRQKSEGEDKASAKMKALFRKRAVSQFGSLTAQLSDGMILALSQFGPTGESYLQPYLPTLSNIHVAETTSQITGIVTPTRSKTNIAKTKGNTVPEVEKEKHEPTVVESEVIKEKAAEIPKQYFQELFVTCPDGLSVKYFLQSSVGVVPESENDRHLMVRQSYQFKTKGVQSCESARAKYIQTEVSRIITANGDVIKNMVDGSVEVLSADGRVGTLTGSWADSSSIQQDINYNFDKQVQDETHKKKKATMKNYRTKSIHLDEVLEEPTKIQAPISSWVITHPDGERSQVSKESGVTVELDSLPVFFASDPETLQTMITRDDHVIIVHYPEGATVVEHSDGTRISTYYRDITEVKENIDEEDEAPPEKAYVQTVKFVKVECPAYATVEFNTATSENLTLFGSGTSINVFPDGYYMIHHSKGGRIEIDVESTMTYFPRRNRFSEHVGPINELQYVLNHNADVIIETVDTNGNIFNVHSNGESIVTPALGEDTLFSKLSQLVVENDGNLYDHHAPRFFIIHADGSGTELLRYENVAEYLLMADQNPAAAVLKEALPGHPGVTGITILKPYMSGISEKWLKNYDQNDIVPKGLRCRDLKTLPSFEYKKPGPKFGTNVGKGLNIGTAIKTPVKIPILKCPEKLEFRQLLQYKPVTDEKRKRIQVGLSQYANAVIARMHAENLMAIEDPRLKEERNVAHDLKTLTELQKLETREFDPDQAKVIYEQAVVPPTHAPASKPATKWTEKDWKQLKNEKDEVAEAKIIIKNKIFEPYFASELGKAFYQIKGKDGAETMSRPLQDPCTIGTTVKQETNKSSSHVKNSNILNVPFTVAGKCQSTFKDSKSKHLKKNNHVGFTSDVSISDSTSHDIMGNEVIPTNIYGQPGFVDDGFIPAAIKGGKPGAHPNIKFRKIEDPVRRKVKTASIAGATIKSTSELTKMRGIICNPQWVHFGTLREGFMYSYTVTLTNTGIDACRFKIKPPAPATGFRVKYTSGSVAAGMSVDLNLELYAIAGVKDGTVENSKFTYVVDIITETDFLQLPVVANILTNEDYDTLTVAPHLERKTSARRIARRPHLSIIPHE